jgi:hypothetical protein
MAPLRIRNYPEFVPNVLTYPGSIAESKVGEIADREARASECSAEGPVIGYVKGVAPGHLIKLELCQFDRLTKDQFHYIPPVPSRLLARRGQTADVAGPFGPATNSQLRRVCAERIDLSCISAESKIGAIA